jgi:hypothetical protein
MITNCKYCSESFDDSFTCEDHTKLIHKKVPVYICKICKEKYLGTDNFDKHLTFAHGTKHWEINLGLKQMTRMMS